MTIVDIYDALTTTRSYRKRLPPEVALEIMWEEAKKGWWDQDVLGEFEKMLQQKSKDAPQEASATSSASA